MQLASCMRHVFVVIAVFTTSACRIEFANVDDESIVDPIDPNASDLRPGSFAPTSAHLRHLTQAQLIASVRDLLGSEAASRLNAPADSVVNGFSTVGAATIALQPQHVENIEASAYDVARIGVASETAQRFRVCLPTQFDDAPCMRATVSAFGIEFFRRPMSDVELQRWTAIGIAAATAFGDFDEGIIFAVAGLMQSPNFLYLSEFGDSNAPTRRLTSIELASRLSYFIIGSTPPRDLLDAAIRGELLSSTGLEMWTEILLQDPRAKEALKQFFFDRLLMQKLDGLERDALDLTTRAAMKEEVRRIVDDVVFERDADIRELFDGDFTFVNDQLAGFYGISLPGSGAEFVRVTSSAQRPLAGLLTTGAFLTSFSHSTRTSPTLRGKFIRETLMCRAVPAPPPNVNTNLPFGDNDTPQTTRDRLSAHVEDPSCAACHLLTDPLGFAFENFDQNGRTRTHENGLPIDTSASIGGDDVNDASAFGDALAQQRVTTECLVRNLFRQATGHLEDRGEEPALIAVHDVLEGQGYRLKRALVALVVSDAFTSIAAAEGEE